MTPAEVGSQMPLPVPTDPELAALLPEILVVLRGKDDAQFKLGEGNDGTVYQLFDPRALAADPAEHRDPYGGRFKGLCIKVWKESYQRRSHEIDVHLVAQSLALKYSEVPKLIHVDIAAGAFIMERVDGKTAAQALIGRRRFPGRTLFDYACIAFLELNQGGVIHDDAHTSNWMLTDIEEELVNTRGGTGEDTIVVDGKVWIIDFGRSRLSTSGDDRLKLRQDLGDRARAGY